MQAPCSPPEAAAGAGGVCPLPLLLPGAASCGDDAAGVWLLVSGGEIAAVADRAATLRAFMQQVRTPLAPESACPAGVLHATSGWRRRERQPEGPGDFVNVWWPLRIDDAHWARSAAQLRRGLAALGGATAGDPSGAALKPAAALLDAALSTQGGPRQQLLALCALALDSAAAAVAHCGAAGELRRRVEAFAPRCLGAVPPGRPQVADLARSRAGAERGRHRLLLADDFPVLLHYPLACCVLAAAGGSAAPDTAQVRDVLAREAARRAELLCVAAGGGEALEAEAAAAAGAALRAVAAAQQAAQQGDAGPRLAAAVAEALAAPAEDDAPQWPPPREEDEAACATRSAVAAHFRAQPPGGPADLRGLCALRDDARRAEPCRGAPAPPPVVFAPDLPAHAAALLPEGLGYYDEAVTEGEERALLEAAERGQWAAPREGESMSRRVQHHGYTFLYPAGGMDLDRPIPGGLPAWAAELARRLERRAGLPSGALTQLTVNEYLPGQGIAPHIDCLATIGSPLLTLSLGSDVAMLFAHPPTARRQELLLRRRSLCVMSGPARDEWTHSIAKRATDPCADGGAAEPVRGSAAPGGAGRRRRKLGYSGAGAAGCGVRRRQTRVSFTFRVVPPAPAPAAAPADTQTG